MTQSIFSIAALAVMMLSIGCDKKTPIAPAEPEKKAPAKQIQLSALLQFKDPEMKKLFAEKKIDLQNLSVSGKKDLEKLFGNITECNVREKPASIGAKDKTFFIDQKVKGIPVYAATAVLRCSADGKVKYFSCNFSSAALKLQVKPRKLTPELQTKLFGKTKTTCDGDMIFDPILVNLKGNTALTWKFTNDMEVVLIDQTTEKKVFVLPLSTSMKAL